MLAAMLLNQKAWLVSPSISIPMGCHGAGNDYQFPSVSEWWTWKTLNVQLLIIFSLHIMSNSTHKQSSSLIFMTKTGSSWKWPYENLKWTDHVHSDSEASFFFTNRVFILPAIFLLIHLSGCVTSVTKPESWSISSSSCGSKFHTLFLWLHCSVCAKCTGVAVVTCREDCLQCCSWPTLHTPWNVWVGAKFSITQNSLDHWS